MNKNTLKNRLIPLFTAALFLCSSCSNTVHFPPVPPPPCAFDETVPFDDSVFDQKIETVPGKIIAVGDLHGDLGALTTVLAKAQLIDAQGHWSGGNATLVQTGDILDRGDEELALIAFLERLKGEARAAGGAVYALTGNHEILNMEGTFSYTSAVGISSFSDAGLPRAQAFAAGGQCARYFSRGPVALYLAGNIFVHGGVLPENAQEGLPAINKKFSAWMRNKAKAPHPTDSEMNVVWTRLYSSSLDCATLSEALELLGAKRMIMGHTVQSAGINAACNDTLYRIDTGMSKYYYNGPKQALLIDNDQVSVIK